MGNKLASLSAGPRGPLLLQDHVLIDEMAHFDRERIPERVVHAKGAGTSNVTIALNKGFLDWLISIKLVISSTFLLKFIRKMILQIILACFIFHRFLVITTIF